MSEEIEERRKEHWHLSKNVTLSTMLSLVVLLFTGIYAFAQTETQIVTLKEQVVEAAKDRIHKATVEQMFQTRDVQIQNVEKSLDEVKEEIKTNQRLLIKILQELPK